METRSSDPLVWIDCEMTGLDPNRDTIISIACFITDHELNILEPAGFDIVIHHGAYALDNMSPWCVEHHGKSGLAAASYGSQVTAEEASSRLIEYVKRWAPEPGKALLAGNSVHADRAFLAKWPYAPLLDYLHYRILDVSSIKEAVRRWSTFHVLFNIPRKKKSHTSREDILESIEEARYYKAILFDVFKEPPPP